MGRSALLASARRVLACLMGTLVTAAVSAQEPPSLHDLAKLRANPLSGMHNVTLQDQVNFEFAGTGQAQHVVTLQAV